MSKAPLRWQLALAGAACGALLLLAAAEPAGAARASRRALPAAAKPKSAAVRPKPAAARPKSAARTPVSGRPDAALYQEARAGESRLRASARLAARRAEWEAVVLRYRKVIARYPRSGYCDNALLAIGDLYRDMSRRFAPGPYREDALVAYRALVAEYPSSSLGEDALWSAIQVSTEARDRRRVADAARAYLDTYPEGRRAAQVKALLRQREPASPLPQPPPPGLASVFDLKSWSGASSTRVVVELERKVPIESDLAKNPDRLWIDLKGARLHPNLAARRGIPVGDGLLEQVRIGKNRDDVVRIVLDFKDVWEHQVFYLENPTRLVIDVRGQAAAPAAQAASASPATAAPPASVAASQPVVPPPAPAASSPASRGPSLAAPAAASAPMTGNLPGRRVNGMVPADTPSSTAPAKPIVLTGVDRLPGAEPAARRTVVTVTAAPAPVNPTPAPDPPTANRAGSYSLARQLGLGARRIVIDAGHGGHDPGTIGRGGLQEKDLVLDVALRLERLVRQELGTEVVLTRGTDVFIPLEERTAIANSRGADLFLSIHANASRNPGARGIETYFLNFARNSHAEAVAARENAISPATLKDLQSLVKAITLNSKIDESRDFAAAVQENMVSGVKAEHAVLDRGVHTAPFYVLIGANMPAVLAEIAFVSNPEDEKRLKSPEYRELLARSLLRGVRSYLESLNRTQLRQLTGSQRRSTVAEGRNTR